MATLTFLGANRQVTGSQYCLEAQGKKLLVDCGLVQERAYLGRNWEPCPVPAREVCALLLTHVHIDHCGLIPKFVREGFHGPIYATPPSRDLIPIMLRDSARIQEEDAAYKKRRHEKEGRRGPHPEIPLYTTEDAEQALPLFRSAPYGKRISINDVFGVVFHDAGHILGSAMLEVTVADGTAQRSVVFSGDIGQWGQPLVRDPSTFARADYVVMESTYGDRDHPDGGDIAGQLAQVIKRTVERGGNVVIPVFAVERAQELMYYLSRLVRAGRIPDIPIYLDSPMAVDVTDVFRHNAAYLDGEARALIESGEAPFRFPGLHLVRDVKDSKAINEVERPCIIMSTAGMCNAGRIKHHLRQNIGRAESTVVFVGYQAEGTLGRQIVQGDEEVRIHGRYWPVKAEITEILGLSAHADRSDLLRWLSAFEQPPQHLFLTHGEEAVSLRLAEHVRTAMGWDVDVPSYGESVNLD